MKIAPRTPGNNTGETSGRPKLRNINNVESEVIEETPAGVDWKFKAAAVVLFLLIIGVYVKGTVKINSLTKELDGLNKQLTEIQAEALLLGITEDEDGDVIIPEVTGPVDVSERVWIPLKQETMTCLNPSSRQSSTGTALLDIIRRAPS